MRKKNLVYLVLIMLSLQCRERYNVPYGGPDTGFLVVEGLINYNGQTTIQLSRSTKLNDSNTVYEKGASLQVEDSDNNTYPLTEEDSGRYRSDYLSLDPSRLYRLRIITKNNKEYASDFRPVTKTPDLDSISWKRQDGGVEIFVNSNHPEIDTRYYKWEYVETWEFDSKFAANLQYKITPYEDYVDKYDNPQTLEGNLVEIEYFDSINFGYNKGIYTCWKTHASTSILTGSSIKLSSNTIFQPLVFHPENSWELSKLYSILIIQHGISEEAYNYYEKMKKNSESLGTLFDAQPTEDGGNIHCISNPSEEVVGFVEVTSSREKRIFISKSQLPGWLYDEGCPETLKSYPNIPLGYKILSCEDSIPSQGWYYYIRTCVMNQGRGMLPVAVTAASTTGKIIEFSAAPSACVDCRLRGTNQKPSFWP